MMILKCWILSLVFNVFLSYLQVYPNARKQIYVPPQRIIHFDLKGAPPKVSYMKQVFALVKKLGATGLLLEWEDMFPWRGKIT